MSDHKRLLVLILIMTGVALVVGGITITVLYRVAINETRERLVETAQSQARLIEATARFDRIWSKDYPQGSTSATLSQITDAHERYKGFGKTGEFTLARSDGGNIVFLLSHRHADLADPKPVSLDSELAEPMRRALLGQSGTVIGLDYRGVTVVAAHEPVAELELGIVAKIDLAEVRAPFVKAGIFAAGSALFVILLGSALSIRISSPVLRRLRVLYEESQQQLAERRRAENALQCERNNLLAVLGAMEDGVHVVDQQYVMQYANLALEEDFGPHERRKCYEYFHDRQEVCPGCKAQQISDGKTIRWDWCSSKTRKTYEQLDTPLTNPDGSVWKLGISRDVTKRRRAERALQLSHRVLEIVNRNSEIELLLQEFVAEVKDFSDCAAVGIRILDDDGSIPYQAYHGFSREFYELESPLSIKTDQCMCINIIRGELAPKLPCYTEGGSFYINGTTQFLATTPEEAKGLSRNICNHFGYESVGLIPIRLGKQILGLIHVADHQEDAISPETIEALEKVAMQLGEAIQRVYAEESLKEAHEELERRVEERTAELTAANERLRHEIEERSDAEAALRESQSRLIHAQHVARLGFWEWNVISNDLFWSDEIYRIFGISEGHFRATYDAFMASVHPDDRDLVQRHVDAALHKNAGYSLDHRIVLPCGDVRYVHEQGEVYRDRDGSPVRMLGTVVDITERKQAEELLRKTKQRLELAVRGTSDGLWDWNVLTNEIWFAPRFKELLGFEVHELPDTFASWDSRLHPDDRNRTLEATRLHFEQRRPYDVEYRLRTRSGAYRWFHARGEAIRDETGKVVRMAGSLQDITDRKELEKELSRISTYEQQRIGQELHDGTQQELAGLGLIAQSLAEALGETAAPEAKMATRLSQGLGEALERLRRLARGLIPLDVYERGLMSALAELALKVNGLPEITCSFECDENVEIGDSFVAAQLHAIAQEAVTNAMKHGRADRILISLHGNHEVATLEICDDGEGIQCESDQMTGMGLRIMRYRAGIAGAVLDIQPADGGGTVVTCRLPNATVPT